MNINDYYRQIIGCFVPEVLHFVPERKKYPASGISLALFNLNKLKGGLYEKAIYIARSDHSSFRTGIRTGLNIRHLRNRSIA